jgi:hypothetical protein
VFEALTGWRSAAGLAGESFLDRLEARGAASAAHPRDGAALAS